MLALLCVAGGTLTKWTAPAFFYLTVVPLLAWRGELAAARWLAAPGGVLCRGGSVRAVGDRGGAASRMGGADRYGRERGARIGSRRSRRGAIRSTTGTYPLLVFAAHLPVAFFALLTFRPSFWAKWDDRGRLLLQLLHCWTWPNLLFWSLVPNHNVRYALPLLAGADGVGRDGTDWGDGTVVAAKDAVLVGFLCLWVGVKVVFVEVVIPATNREARSDARSRQRCGSAFPPISRFTSSA